MALWDERPPAPTKCLLDLYKNTRQTFCVAEGPELLMYNSESDSIAGESPRARFLVKGARSVPKGRSGGMELEVRTYFGMVRRHCCSNILSYVFVLRGGGGGDQRKSVVY